MLSSPGAGKVRRWFTAAIEMNESFLLNDGESTYAEGWDSFREDLERFLRQFSGHSFDVVVEFDEWDEVYGCQCRRGIERDFEPCTFCKEAEGYHSSHCTSDHCQQEREAKTNAE